MRIINKSRPYAFTIKAPAYEDGDEPVRAEVPAAPGYVDIDDDDDAEALANCNGVRILKKAGVIEVGKITSKALTPEERAAKREAKRAAAIEKAKAQGGGEERKEG